MAGDKKDGGKSGREAPARPPTKTGDGRSQVRKETGGGGRVPDRRPAPDTGKKK